MTASKLKNTAAATLLTIFATVGGAVTGSIAYTEAANIRDNLMVKYNVKSTGKQSTGVLFVVFGGFAGAYLAVRKSKSGPVNRMN